MDEANSTASLAAREDVLAGWNEQPACLKRQAGLLLHTTRRLRKAAHEGAVASFPTAVAGFQQNAGRLQTTLE